MSNTFVDCFYRGLYIFDRVALSGRQRRGGWGMYTFPHRIALVLFATVAPLSTKRQTNLISYTARINQDILNDAAGSITAIELDRNGANWNQTIRYDVVQSIRCNGPDFVSSLLATYQGPRR